VFRVQALGCSFTAQAKAWAWTLGLALHEKSPIESGKEKYFSRKGAKAQRRKDAKKNL
jgi:hypothetical protein